MEVAYDGGGLGKGNAVGDHTFNGAIEWVRIQLGNDSHQHLIPPQAHLDLAMGPASRESGGHLPHGAARGQPALDCGQPPSTP